MSHDGGFTCEQADQGSQDMAASISRLLEELRGEREKYRQVVEINNANQRSYWAENDALRGKLAEALALAEQLREQCNRQEHGFAQRESGLQRDLAEALRAYDAEVIGRREEVTRLHGELRSTRSELQRLQTARAKAVV